LATSISGDKFFVLRYAVTNGLLAPTNIPAKPEIKPQNQSFYMMERIKLSKGAQVKKRIMPAINISNKFSESVPNKKIPTKAPNIVEITMCLISSH
jgi:hypothetical protein